MSSPRVLVGCPTFEGKKYCLEEYVDGLAQLSYNNFQVCLVDNSSTPTYAEELKARAKKWSDESGKIFEVHRMAFDVESARQRIVQCRNFLREKALKEGFDYFFSLEQDVIPPSNVIEQLLFNEKDFCSGMYLNELQGPGHLRVVAFKENGVDETGEPLISSLTLPEVLPGRLMQVSHVGLGCVLISRNVLKKISFRFEEGKAAWDDIFFCTDTKTAGFNIFLDSRVQCLHWFNEKFFREMNGFRSPHTPSNPITRTKAVR